LQTEDLASFGQRREKTCSSTAASFKGWTIVHLEKGNKWNLRLDGDVMVVSRQSASSLHSLKANSIAQPADLERALGD
jgi:hypothetical protein